MQMVKNYYILGQGGFAHEIYEQFFARSSDRLFGGFIVLNDNKAIIFSSTHGAAQFEYPESAAFILGTGNKHWRKKFLQHFLSRYPATEDYFPSMYSEHAYISKISNIGIGNVFCPFSLVNADANIGDFNLFNVYSSIHHDCTLGSYNVVSPYAGILGYCKVGNYNFFSSHITVVPRTTIGDDNTISAGECLFDDLSNREFFQSGIIYKKPVK
jgi:acetyltransferase-like isoleucine patch superfamily enzyme